jgi:Domain of unknown function (DUF6894)
VKRFFFDYTAKNESLFDYRGQEFGSPAGAIEFAQEIAQSLQHSLSMDWVGWSVEVRGADGEKFYSLAIDGGLMSAA